MADQRPVDRDINLVLVTGAGASREFGVNARKLPLMSDWCASMAQELAEGPAGYLQATGLRHDLDGPAFERQLGTFLQATQAFDRIRGFLAPSVEFQVLVQPVSPSQLKTWQETTRHHLDQIIQIIYGSLYRSFGSPSLDILKAWAAYSPLLTHFGVYAGTGGLVVATTNYDVLAEAALGAGGFRVDCGETPSPQRTNERTVESAGLLRGMPRYTPVLHLHGRTGWYRPRGSAQVQSTDSATHEAGFGTPVVLLPDLEKDYAGDEFIAGIWSDFRESLQRARRVLVLGHSLHDAKLVESIRENIELGRVGVAWHSGPTASATERLDLESKVRTELAGAQTFGIDFTEPLDFDDQNAFHDWVIAAST